MNVKRKPTDSVLARHLAHLPKAVAASALPQDSTLLRHHEQMREAWLEVGRATPAVPDTTNNLPNSALNRHPLAIRLREISAGPRSIIARAARVSRTAAEKRTKPPEDSTLARHYAQTLAVSVAKHPLATHLSAAAACRTSVTFDAATPVTLDTTVAQRAHNDDQVGSDSDQIVVQTAQAQGQPASSNTAEKARETTTLVPNQFKKRHWFARLLHVVFGKKK